MPNLRITNGFDKLSDGNLEIRCSQIINALTDNAHFPSPKPTLAEMQALLDSYSTALLAAREGKRLDIALKNQKRETLIDALHSLGKYVLFVADNDKVVALSSGFSINREPQPAPELTRPEALRLEDGQNAGELELSFRSVPGARAYQYQYTEEPLTESSTWVTQNSTRRKSLFTGLQTGKRYFCRVVVLGVNEQTVYSDVVSRIAQ